MNRLEWIPASTDADEPYRWYRAAFHIVTSGPLDGLSVAPPSDDPWHIRGAVAGSTRTWYIMCGDIHVSTYYGDVGMAMCLAEAWARTRGYTPAVGAWGYDDTIDAYQHSYPGTTTLRGWWARCWAWWQDCDTDV